MASPAKMRGLKTFSVRTEPHRYMNDSLFVALQHMVPQHLISRLVGLVAASELKSIKDPLINWFVKRYQVNLAEAKNQDVSQFKSFNDFFTRELMDGARELALGDNNWMCPVDGAVSQRGAINNGRIFQAKGHDFSALELLGGKEEFAQPFMNGQFTTIYLSPKDYHRIHMPCAGKLTDMVYVPGKLFSVNPVTTEQVPRLFARNERVVCLFDTDQGKMAMVLVGAMIVASIETTWAGQVAPRTRKASFHNYQGNQGIQLDQGAEMGRFKLGSTVVLLSERGDLKWDDQIDEGVPVRLGQPLATF